MAYETARAVRNANLLYGCDDPYIHPRSSVHMSHGTRTLFPMTVVTPTDSFRAQEDARPVYLDCNATSPMDPRVQAEVLRFMAEEYGNAGSRTHGYGQIAKERIIRARQQVADVVTAKPEEVIFTSGAT